MSWGDNDLTFYKNTTIIDQEMTL